MDWNIFALLQKPVYQAILFLALTPLVIILSKSKDAEATWQMAAYVFAFFLVVNAVMIWFSDSPWRYFFVSLGVGVGYLISVALIISILIHILHLKKSEETAMAFLIWIYQPISLLLILLVRWGVQWILAK